LVKKYSSAAATAWFLLLCHARLCFAMDAAGALPPPQAERDDKNASSKGMLSAQAIKIVLVKRFLQMADISLYGRGTLSPPPLSQLSDTEHSPRTSTSVATSVEPSPVQTPVSSRASVNALEYNLSSCCKCSCCAADTSAVEGSQLSDAESFAVLNLSWVMCSAFCWIFHNRLCNFFFRCGCTWNWAGSWDRCVCSRVLASRLWSHFVNIVVKFCLLHP
jgi:hypothetical protein